MKDSKKSLYFIFKCYLIFLTSLDNPIPSQSQQRDFSFFLFPSIGIVKTLTRITPNILSRSFIFFSEQLVWICSIHCKCKRFFNSRSVTSNSLQHHGLKPSRLLCPWDFQARVLEWVAIPFCRGIFPTQGSNHRLLHSQLECIII